MFEDRKQAGQKLGRALKAYKQCDGIVLAIPRGGVEVGFYVAQYLEIPLSVVIVRKLPFPDNPEAGFGAIAEDGSIFFVDQIYKRLHSEMLKRILREQEKELERRKAVLRGGKSLPSIAGKTVLLVDDGIAMGSTMQAAIMCCRKNKAKRIVAAAPVASPSTAGELAEVADEVVILEQPVVFYAVADAYRNWYDVGDDEVINILQKSERL
jgi:putative phosphoribosyl transferase